MKKSRLEAFSDGVIAIIITIIVGNRKSERQDSLGKFALIILVIAYSFYNGLDGRKPLCTASDCCLRHRAVICGSRYTLLQNLIIKYDGSNQVLASAIGKDRKGKISVAFYIIANPLAFVNQWIADALYIIVAAIWLIPDRRIESKISK